MFDRKTLLTVLVSGVVAGGAVQLLHAQTPAVGITVSEVNVKDV